MGKSPAFQFYPQDFLADINVAAMSMEERGCYITLLSHCWIEGCLKGGSRVLQALCNKPSNWKEIWDNISGCFYEIEGVLYHKRLDIERKKQEEWRLKSQQGGIISASIRREKGMKNKSKGSSRVVQPPYEPNVNSSSSSSSSSIKHKYILYGEYKHVRLTQDQYNKLITKFNSKTDDMIQKLDEGIELKGYKYKNHYLAILKWHEKDMKQSASQPSEDVFDKWLEKQNNE
jgi:uncharacterized protein YdaU (DUF1376 family)